ncbi:MAG: GNAT family N-acetyltransferase [Hyphomicrobiales bacterium]|nr:GNAT family N-acetyltransferase [Hyphomicrobiales bacterium]
MQGFTLMATEPLYFVEPAPHARADKSALDPSRWEFRMLRGKGRRDIELALRPARLSDGDALQTYVRGLSPRSRYNRFLGALNELPASELARALSANGRDTLTLLLTSTVDDCETVVGEARVALSCAERAGEFSMSIADDWRHLGLGSALLEEIERKAAADGIELVFGDTLWTNEGMIGLARSRGFRLGPGFEPRLARIQKRLEDASPDLPCRKWNEIAGGAELRAA